MRTNLFLALFAFPTAFALAQDLQLIVPLGHTRRVASIEVSYDRTWMASTDGSSQIRLWDYATGLEAYQLSSPAGEVSSIDFHPSRNLLVSGSVTGVITYWDTKGRLKQTVETGQKNIYGLFFSTAGDTLFTIGEGRELKLWTVSGTQMGTIDTGLEQPVTGLQEHGLIVVGSKSGELALIRPDARRKVLSVSEQRIAAVAFGARGNKVLVATGGGELISVNLNTFDVQKVSAFNIRNQAIVAYDEVIVACGRDTEENLRMFNDVDFSTMPYNAQLDTDKSSESFRFGLRAMCKASDTTFLLADYGQVIREWNLKTHDWEKRTFEGKAAPLYDMALNRDQTQLAIAGGHDVIKVLDLTATSGDRFLTGAPGGTRAIDFHPVNPVVAAYGMDEQIRVINVISGAEVFALRAKGEYSTTPVTFDPTGKYLLRKSSEKAFDFYDFAKKTPKNLKVKNGLSYAFSPDGRRLIFEVKEGLAVFDPLELRELKTVPISGIQDFAPGAGGETAVLLADDHTLQVYDSRFSKLREIKLAEDAASDRIFWSPRKDFLIGLRNTQKKGDSRADFSIKLINPQTGELAGKLPGHSGFVTSLVFLKDKYLLTMSIDGVIKLWNIRNHRAPLLGTVIPLQDRDYVITTPQGHFDATPGAMKQLHYVKNGELIALDQLKSEYYEPNLLSKLLGYNPEPVRSVSDLSGLELYPELKVTHPLKNEGRLGISLSDNGGGIGRIVILINGKEVSGDVRGITNQKNESALEIDYEITDHPFLYTDRVNKITVRAYNEDGTVSSGDKSISVFGEEKTTERPRLFAVIAGVSDYKGDNLDLKFAAKDATDFAHAVSLSASQYLGPENVEMTLLTTDLDTAFWPTKTHIRQAFENYSRQATARDLLVVYLSGHGVNQTGENADFYYLSSDADHGDMNNTVLRNTAAISASEFTEYIKAVPALKQVLVIDACHSGRFASSLASSRSAMSSTQIRSLERMKDRTGMFVLAGSAADAISYETTLFGQGLLTYSLLFGMKGAALRDNEFIDVIPLFQFAANKVPELAEEIGGLQKPEIRLPEEGKSFDIGKLTPGDREKIALNTPKPVYVHSRFQDESDIFDRLGVSELIDSRLLEMSREKDARIVFVDDKAFSGAVSLHGRYSEAETGLLNARVTVVKNEQPVQTLEVEAVNAKVLSEQILLKVLAELDPEQMSGTY